VSAPTAEPSAPSSRVGRVGGAVAGLFGLGWLFCLGHVLWHRIFVTNDSLISYAHTWYVSDRLWHAHRLPMAMPVLSHGKAFAFPYGFIPWTTAAILRPALGDWAVTLMFVVGAAALIIATFLAFPELRRGWWAAAVLANPAILAGLFLGQLPFLWGAAMLLGAVACWRRDRRTWATVLFGLAQATHPAVIMPIALVLVVGYLRWEERPADLLRRYAVSLVPALPAAFLVVRSPVFGETSTMVKAWNFIDTIGPRCLVLVIPGVLAWIARRRPDQRTGMAMALAVLVVLGFSWVPEALPRDWSTFDRPVDRQMLPFLASPAFHRGETYRLLNGGDKKVGLYQLLQAGGRSDSDFFPESMMLQSWPSVDAYSQALRDRNVDVVMWWPSFTYSNHTNERALLDELAGRPQPPSCDGPTVCVRLAAATSTYRLYDITRRGTLSRAPSAPPR
jgi:hypothetical protein